jgi:transketolase
LGFSFGAIQPASSEMLNFQFIPKSEFDRVLNTVVDQWSRLEIFSDMCRLNTLVEVKKAGSGHLGSSFSAMDIVTWLYLEVLNVAKVGPTDPHRDIFFSSKGHDVPGLYAMFYALGILPEEKLLKLRRLNGLDGHPDVHIAGVESNTGSLGMGIGKGRGMAWAKRYLKRGGRVFVMTGDGELQEGQIWESLQTTAHQKVDLTVIVDHNKLQTDLPVEEIIALRNLEGKCRSFGWHVERCNGHDFTQLNSVFARLAAVVAQPKILIADTIKGRGVSFMEKISEMTSCEGKYLWHSGAPGDEPFQKAFEELRARVNGKLSGLGLPKLALKDVPIEIMPKPGVTKQYVAGAYGEELVALAAEHSEIVVLDCDLSADCKVRDFEQKYPHRFIENGIAEQDMVSLAGGLARQGLLPVVNSFASFLTARANEQIYNNACEGTKIIYAAHFAGMIPAGPGKSHQSVRDIGLLSSLPNMILLQPCNREEARQALRFCVKEACENCTLRMNIGPSPREIMLPGDYRLTPGRGATLRPGSDAILFAYGTVMLHEALLASELAEKAGFSLAVINMPWLNRFDAAWLAETLAGHSHVNVLEDHMLAGGMGERLLNALVENRLLGDRQFHRFGLNVLPACGTPWEVLRHHQLDGSSLARKILTRQGGAADKLESEHAGVFNTLEAAQ